MLAALLACLAACGGDDDDDAAGPSDAAPDGPADASVDAAVDAAVACTPTELTPRAPALFDAIVAHLVEHETQDQGDWDLDFGDATAYAPPVLTAAARARCDPQLDSLAAATLGWEGELVRHFGANLSGEGLIGALGLIETYGETGDPDLADLAAQAVETVGGIIDLFGGVLPQDTVEAAGLPYGQTATTGLLTAIELRYVERVDPGDDARLAAALGHARGLDEAMWSPELGYYRFRIQSKCPKTGAK